MQRLNSFFGYSWYGRVFLQATVHRFEKIIPAENIIIVSAMQYKDLIKSKYRNCLDENILLETGRRNTAPCIAYATYKLYKNIRMRVLLLHPLTIYYKRGGFLIQSAQFLTMQPVTKKNFIR